MPRRRFLFALAVIVPLAIFVAAKQAASWRPVAIGRLRSILAKRSGGIRASERWVVVGDEAFDLRCGNSSQFFNRFAGVGRWTWNWANNDKPQLFLDDGQRVLAYDLTGTSERDFTRFVQPLVRLSPARARVEMVVMGHYFRWKMASRALQHHIRLYDINEREALALSRDGETVIYLDTNTIREISTRTGATVRHDITLGTAPRRRPLSQISRSTIRFSPYGTYVLYQIIGPGFSRTPSVVETRTGRVLWSPAQKTAAVFSPDETLLALPLTARKCWEIRDAKTGALLQTLPLAPGATTAAFSPDNSTLYSVAGGVLYRQRAR